MQFRIYYIMYKGKNIRTGKRTFFLTALTSKLELKLIEIAK